MATSVNFVRPERTLAISVTGPDCELACRHCQGRYLGSMLTPAAAISAIARPQSSFASALVSGGCDQRLGVLSRQHVPFLAELRRAGLRINAHAGLVGEEDARALVPVVDVFSVDYLPDRESGRRIYGVDPGDGYRATVRTLLGLGAQVVPHVCIGLDPRGSEERALGQLRQLGCDRVVLLVFIPTPGTPLADRKPPALVRISQVFAAAVAEFGDRVTLGCMRPGGSYRTEIDALALDSGISSIVRPTPRAIAAGGDRASWWEECCALC